MLLTLSLSLPVSISLSLSHTHTVCLTLGALNMQITSFLIKITVQCFWFLARFENTFLADFVGLLAPANTHSHTHPFINIHTLTKRALFAGLLWALALGSISANIAAAALRSSSPLLPLHGPHTHNLQVTSLPQRCAATGFLGLSRVLNYKIFSVRAAFAGDMRQL